MIIDDDLDDDCGGDEQLCAFPTCARRTRGIFCARHRAQVAVLHDDCEEDGEPPPRAA